MKKWFLINKNTGAYTFSYIESETQPLSSTDIDPGDITNPIWKNNQWVAGEAIVPEINITTQDQINISMTKELADTKQKLETANAGIVALTKMVAEIKEGKA